MKLAWMGKGLIALCGSLALMSCETINLERSSEAKKKEKKAEKKVAVPFSRQLNSYEREALEGFEESAAADREESHKKVFGF